MKQSAKAKAKPPRWAKQVPYNPPGTCKEPLPRLRDLSGGRLPAAGRDVCHGRRCPQEIVAGWILAPGVQPQVLVMHWSLAQRAQNAESSVASGHHVPLLTQRCEEGREELRCQSALPQLYTPMHKPNGGGAETVNEIEYLRSALCYAMRSPIDAAVNLSGTSRTKVTRVYDYLRTACAFVEETKGREAFFNDQEVEVDSARTVATRTSLVQTEHRGRVLGFTERLSGRQAYVQLPNTITRRGAPTAPETREVAQQEITARIGPAAILCADGSQAWGAAVAATCAPRHSGAQQGGVRAASCHFHEAQAGCSPGRAGSYGRRRTQTA